MLIAYIIYVCMFLVMTMAFHSVITGDNHEYKQMRLAIAKLQTQPHKTASIFNDYTILGTK